MKKWSSSAIQDQVVICLFSFFLGNAFILAVCLNKWHSLMNCLKDNDADEYTACSICSMRETSLFAFVSNPFFIQSINQGAVTAVGLRNADRQIVRQTDRQI